MTLTVGTNSYIDVADADAFFVDALGADAWDTAEAATKAKALVTATRDIDRRGFLGKRAATDQVLQFPRCQMTAGGWVCDDTFPQAVLDATCEQALFLLGMTAYERDRKRQHTLGVIGGSIGSTNEYSSDAI